MSASLSPPRPDSPHSWKGEVRLLLALAAPMVVGLLGRMTQGLCDAAMIGQVGTVEVAACGFGHNLTSPAQGLAWGLASGVSVLVSEARGAGDQAKARSVAAAGWILMLVAGVFLLGVQWLVQQTLGHWGQAAEVVAITPAYYWPVALSILVVAPTCLLESFSNAMNRPWPPLLIGLGGVVLNILLNWLLIYGHWGFPPMGLAGAAWATCLARIVSFLVLLVWVRKTSVLADWRPIHWWKEGVAELKAWLKPLVTIGLPAGVATVAEMLAFNFAAIMSGWIGMEAGAAHHVAITCAATTFMVPLGLSIAASVRVGEAVGGEERGRLRAIAQATLIVALCFMAAASLLYVGMRGTIARFFLNDSPATMIAAQLLGVVACFQLADGFQVVCNGLLRGLRDTRFPAALSFITWWGLSLPCGYLLAFTWHWGPVGIWWGLAAGLACAALTLGLRAWRRFR